MKTPEDEAFEYIERRQGGFQAKRQMAADKLQEPDEFTWRCACDDCQAKYEKWNPPQPAQEPVAWKVSPRYEDSDGFFDYTDSKDTADTLQTRGWTITPLYEQPPQREWVGLTDADRYEFAAAQHSWEDLCLAVEAKLKEKNG
jgi:hypothetical protein